MNLIFDFDGTICDSLETVVAVIDRLKPIKNFTISVEAIRTIGTVTIFKDASISEEELNTALLLIREALTDNINAMNVFPGLKEVLFDLSRHHKLYIVTSNTKSNVELFLKKHRVDMLFTDIDDSSDYMGKDKKLSEFMKRNKLEAKQTVYIGDETRDMLAAQKVGITSAAVTWGYESKKLIKESMPDVMVDVPRDLLKL